MDTKPTSGFVWHDIWPFLFGLACSLFMFWPGIVTHDAAYQYAEITRGYFGNWHPPFMALLWAVCDRVWHGPALFFIVKSSILWLAFYHLARGLRDCGLKSRLFLVALGLSPLLVEVTATLSTDALFLGFLLLGAALTFRIFVGRDKKASRYFWAYGALLCAYLSREYNAVPSLLPFFAILSWSLFVRPSRRVFALILLLLSLPLASMAERGVLELATTAKGWGGTSYGYTADFNSHPENVIMLHDLAGISLGSGHDVYPAFIRDNPAHSLETLKRCYTPQIADPLYFDWSSAGYAGCSYANPLVQNHSLFRDWLSAIYREPVAYMMHRLRVNRYFLQIATQNDNLWALETTDHLDAALPKEQTAAWTTQPHILLAAYQGLCQILARHTPIFRPYFWGFAGLFFLCWARWVSAPTQARMFAAALLLSGLVQIPVLAVIAPADQYRYWSWVVVAVALAVYVLLANSLRKSIQRHALRPQPNALDIG